MHFCQREDRGENDNCCLTHRTEDIGEEWATRDAVQAFRSSPKQFEVCNLKNMRKGSNIRSKTGEREKVSLSKLVSRKRSQQKSEKKVNQDQPTLPSNSNITHHANPEKFQPSHNRQQTISYFSHNLPSSPHSQTTVKHAYQVQNQIHVKGPELYYGLPTQQNTRQTGIKMKRNQPIPQFTSSQQRDRVKIDYPPDISVSKPTVSFRNPIVFTSKIQSSQSQSKHFLTINDHVSNHRSSYEHDYDQPNRIGNRSVESSHHSIYDQETYLSLVSQPARNHTLTQSTYQKKLATMKSFEHSQCTPKKVEQSIILIDFFNPSEEKRRQLTQNSQLS